MTLNHWVVGSIPTRCMADNQELTTQIKDSKILLGHFLDTFLTLNSRPMSVRCYHPVFGEITFDHDRPAVENPDLAERINWLLKPENYRKFVNPDGSQYALGDNGRFVAVLKIPRNIRRLPVDRI
jgi:hypothetical protein